VSGSRTASVVITTSRGPSRAVGGLELVRKHGGFSVCAVEVQVRFGCRANKLNPNPDSEIK
jgi:hypothetical protein